MERRSLISIESAIEFVENVSGDADLKNYITGNSKEGIISFAATHGFDFTIDELEYVCESINENGEVVDMEKLENFVGGIIGTPISGAALVYAVGKGEGWF